MRGCQLRMRFERSLISSSRTVVLDEIRATISSSSTVVDPKIRATISARAEVCSEARKARKALASLLAALKLRARIALVTFLWAGRYRYGPESGADATRVAERGCLILPQAESSQSHRGLCELSIEQSSGVPEGSQALKRLQRGSRWWAFPRLGAVSILPESVRAARRLASCGAIA
jgi:hypothetical protein